MNRTVRKTAAAGFISTILFALPGFAAAQSAMVQTTQVLPPGGSSCAPLSLGEATPYIYDNELNSFDIVVRDTSYVSLLASVGETSVPFRYMTRFADPQGVRIHVDVEATSVSRDVPVSVTLLSSLPGKPTCLSVVSFVIPGTGKGVPAVSGATSRPQPVQHATIKPVKTVPATSSTSTVVAGPAKETPRGGWLGSVCEGNGTLQLWFLLLAIYIVIVSLTALAQPPLVRKSPAVPLALILGPLVLLIGFWYFAPWCRAASWIPTLSILVAIAGLLAAFREQEVSASTAIQLPAAKEPSRRAPAVAKAVDKPKK